MELVERYVYAVGRHLPRKMREDVESELHSLLLDSVDSRAEETGRPADDALATEVLREFGSPGKMAASYQSRPQYVVGPQLFSVYRLVLIIVVAVLTAMQFFGLVLSMAGVPLFSAQAGELIGSGLLNLISALLGALGGITLAFFVLERFVPAASLDMDEDWDPADLPPSVRIDDRISVVGQVVTICISAGLLILFNFFPEIIGVYSFANGQWDFAPVLAPAYRTYLPWLNLLWIGTIMLSVGLLVRGRWEPATRWLDLVREVFTAVVLIMLATGPSLVGVRTDFSLSQLTQALANLDTSVSAGIDVSIRIAFAAAFIGVSVSALQKLLQLVRAPGRPLVQFKSQ